MDTNRAEKDSFVRTHEIYGLHAPGLSNVVLEDIIKAIGSLETFPGRLSNEHQMLFRQVGYELGIRHGQGSYGGFRPSPVDSDSSVTIQEPAVRAALVCYAALFCGDSFMTASLEDALGVDPVTLAAEHLQNSPGMLPAPMHEPPFEAADSPAELTPSSELVNQRLSLEPTSAGAVAVRQTIIFGTL